MRPIVSTLAPAQAGDWARYVAIHPAATPYHDLGWRSVFERGLGYEPHYLLARDGQTGPVIGCMPLLAVPSLLGRRLVSVPFRDRGGMLWSSIDALRALVDRARSLAGEIGAASLVLKSIAPYPSEAMASGLVERRHWVRSHVDLRGRTSEGFMAALSAKTRNMIRQAERAGLGFEEGALDRSGLATWYGLHVRSQRNLGVPPFPRRFFACMGRELGGSARLLVVRDRAPIAAAITLRHRGTVYYAYAASDPDARATRPNDLLVSRMFSSALASGAEEVDLGSDSPDQAGLLFFKRKWLASQDPAFTYGLGRAPDVLDSSAPRYRAARRVLRAMPLGCVELVGRIATRFLG
jgi:CelD/BcsL family acetyltransferase involved in cellulose biosynthesis